MEEPANQYNAYQVCVCQNHYIWFYLDFDSYEIQLQKVMFAFKFQVMELHLRKPAQARDRK